MEITIMSYNGESVPVDLGDDVAVVNIEVVSGDEIAEVIYKDFSILSFDSCYLTNNIRIMDCRDASYEVYNFQKEDNLIDNHLWKNRRSSYCGIDIAYDDEEPNGFVADEWYRDTFGENDGK